MRGDTDRYGKKPKESDKYESKQLGTERINLGVVTKHDQGHDGCCQKSGVPEVRVE